MSQLDVVENQFVLPVKITEAGTVTKTLNTAGTYVDKNIKLDVTTPKAEYEVKSANLVTATVAMVDNAFASETETRYPITITADATAPEVKVGIKPGKAGFAAETDVVTVAKADAEQASKKIYIKEGALASNSTASAEGGRGVVLGEKANTAPATGFYVKASAAGSASVETAGWVDPNNNTPVDSSGDAFYPIAEATLLNEAAEQENYTEKDAPILISGSGLYINEGYIKNTYIPLAKLVPDEANVVAGEDGNSNLIYKTVSVYDKDAKLIAGTMDDATLSAIVANNAAATVNAVTFTLGEDGKFAVAGTGTISGTASVGVDKVGYAKKELTGTGAISGTATVAAKVEAATTKATADKANITVKPVIAKENTSTALSDDITTEVPTSGHYVVVSAAAIENTATVTPSISKTGYALEGTTGTAATVTGGSEASGSYYVKIQDAEHNIAKQPSTVTAPSTTVTTSFAEGENFVQPAVYTAEQATTGKFIKIDANATTANGSVVARAKCTATEGYITAISKDITITEAVSVAPAAATAKFIKVYDGEITE